MKIALANNAATSVIMEIILIMQLYSTNVTTPNNDIGTK